MNHGSSDNPSGHGFFGDNNREKQGGASSGQGFFGDKHGSATPERNGADGHGSGAQGGGLFSTPPSHSNPPPYVADKEDLLDQHVAYYLRHHPDVHRKNALVRKRPGVYELNNREVLVEWQYATEPGGQGHLVVLDGPLRQPFAHYMEMNETSAEYDTNSLQTKSALHMIPKEKRMSFGDQNKVYTRLEAMKVAKEQALVRETAADYVKSGKDVPGELMTKYKKTIAQKLGPNRRTAPSNQNSGNSPPAQPNPEPPRREVHEQPPPPAPTTSYQPPQQAAQPAAQAPLSYAPPSTTPWQPYNGGVSPSAAASPYNGGVSPSAAATAGYPGVTGWNATAAQPGLPPPQGLFGGPYQLQPNTAISYRR